MIKFLKKNRKGLTLLELIIGLAILTIVLTMIFSFFDFGNRTVLVGFSQNKAQADLRIASDYVKNTVRYATEVSLSSPETVSIEQTDSFDYIYFDYTSGSIKYSGYNSGNTREVKSFGTGVQNTSKFWIEKTGEAQIIGINLYGQDTTQNYELITSFELPNVKIKQNAIVDQTDATLIRFKIDKTLITPDTPSSSDPTLPVEEETIVTFALVDVKFIINTNTYKNNYIYRITLSTDNIAETKILETSEDKSPYSVTFYDVPSEKLYDLKIERKPKNGSYQVVVSVYPKHFVGNVQKTTTTLITDN